MKFQGPLQSYGTDSHFETRHTDSHPSKAAVLGMVAAAMGIRREETDKLKELQSLRMLVRTEQPGRMSKDYHIAAKYDDNGNFKRNYVTNRYYLEDAVFLVALEGEDGLTERIYDALQRPYFPLFYGRRSCPVNYDFLLGLFDGASADLLKRYPWTAAEWYQKKAAVESRQRKSTLTDGNNGEGRDGRVRLDLYGDVKCLQEARQRALRRDEPVTFSQKRRSHVLRYEAHDNLWIVNPYAAGSGTETEHDAFAALDA